MGGVKIGRDIVVKCTARNSHNNLMYAINVLIDTGSNIDCVTKTVVTKLQKDVIRNEESIIINGLNGNLETTDSCDLDLLFPDGSHERIQPWIVNSIGKFDVILGTGSIAAMRLFIKSDSEGQFYLVRDGGVTPPINCWRQSVMVTEHDEKSRELFEDYAEVFKDVLHMPPQRTSDLHIELVEKICNPVALGPYRFPVTELPELQKQIKELLLLGQIEHSQSAWAAPCRFVPKKDQSVPRLVCDYRRLNKLIRDQQCPMPRPTDFYHKLHGACIFSVIDLKSGFHQIRLTPESKELTAFITPFGLYQWTVVPFGIKTGPANFMGFMFQVFQGLIGEFMFIYVDDILIFSQSEEEHREHVRIILDRLKDYDIIAHRRKSRFFLDRVDFLGMEISSRGLRPKEERLKELQKIRLPESSKELQRYLGIVGYYRHFVDAFAATTAPLFDKIKNSDRNGSLTWTDNEVQLFEKTKLALLNSPTLTFLNEKLPAIVTTDASDIAIGAVLSQAVDGQEYTVEYFSRKLSPAEQRYSTHEKELLAIVDAIPK